MLKRTMDATFVVLSLPRSRSKWLSEFLSYRDWHCGHDQIRYMRSLDDVKAWLSMPNTGTCETAGAPFWRLLAKYSPQAQIVTVRRDVDEVFESLRKAGDHPDESALKKVLVGLDRKLDQIEGRMTNVFSVKFADLEQESVCASVFEHCLPYRHDADHWRSLGARNIQINYPALIRYVKANLPAINKLLGMAKQAMVKDMAMTPADIHGVEIQQESFEKFSHECGELFRHHCLEIGEHPDNWMNKNIPLMKKLDDLGLMQIVVGRSNGKAFGYLMTLICPSLEEENRVTAQHAAFYASPDMPGLGLKLQRAALSALKDRGVSEAFMRAGIRGDGDRMDVIYRRLGGQDFGRVFRVDLAA